MATPNWKSTPWYDMNGAFGYIQIGEYAGSITNVNTEIFESNWTTSLNQVVKILGAKNYAIFKLNLGGDFEKFTRKKGFQLTIGSGAFTVTDIAKFKVDDVEFTPTIDGNVITLIWDKERAPKAGNSGLKVEFRCVVENPQFIASQNL